MKQTRSITWYILIILNKSGKMKEDLGLDKIKKKYTYEYNRKSIIQSDRLRPALFNGYVGLDERSFEDLVQQLAAYAKDVVFYDETTPETISGNKVTWETFFDGYRDENGLFSMEALEKKMNEGDVEPQMALMLAFLKLYQIEQNNFNGILKRFHDFYYKDILGFSPLHGYVGKAVVFPTIEGQVDNVLIPKGSLLDAGRDDDDNPIYYATCEDFCVNHVKVSDCVAYNNLDDIKENIQDKFKSNKDKPKPYFQPICGKESEQTTKQSCSSVPTDTYGIAFSSEKFLAQDGTVQIKFNELVSNECVSHNDFVAEYTGEKGWIEGTLCDSCKEKNIYVEINQNEQPIVNYEKKIHGEGYDSVYPIVRLKIKNPKTIQNIKLNNFKSISVVVKNSQSAIIENKFGLVENRVGAVVFGSMCAMDDYFQIKAPYDGLILSQPVISFTDSSVACSEARDDVSPKIVDVSPKSDDDSTKGSDVYSFKLLDNTYSYQEEAIRLAEKMIDYQKHGCTPLSCDYKVITLKSPIKIDYKIELKDFLLFSTSPFGVNNLSSKINTGTDGNSKSLQPEQKAPETAPKNEDKNLFCLSSSLDMSENHLQIGLVGVTKPCVVSLYFKINSLVLHGHYSPRWYYVSKNNDSKNNIWKKMGGNVLRDTTNNFRQSGCVTLYIDNDVIDSMNEQTCLPNEKIWLKLNFKKMNSAEEKDYEDMDNDGQEKARQRENRTDMERFNFSAIEEVRTQGLEVEYSAESIGSLSYGTVLKAGSIKSLVTNIDGIKKIEQPYDGAMGRADEDEGQFRARVSERLRHKGKAWTGWDYERLILENFPQISAAKYLPCRNMNGKFQPGHTYILLAPNPQIIEQVNPLRPNMSWDLLYDIYQCVKNHATTFAQQEFHVMELQYEELRVKCTVRLKKGLIDADYYSSLIKQELTKFIAPWSDNSQIVEFSRGVKPNDILYFIENLEYVDYVEEFGLLKDEQQIEMSDDDDDMIRPEKVTSILTSAEDHDIKVWLSEP